MPTCQEKILSIGSKNSLVAFDIGARGGIKRDLELLASSTDYVLFEPDPGAFEQLKLARNGSPWRSIACVNQALAGKNETFYLNLYRQRGCSSRYTANSELGRLFRRGDYYIHDGVAEVKARTLDDLVREGSAPPPSFIKIDVQGMEFDVFSGAVSALRESVVGIRTEVSFFAIYPGQPLFAELEQQLRPFGFVPMRWLEFHEWRRRTKAKYPETADDLLPASRGQMMHADVLFLLHPEILPSETEAQIRRMIRLGLVAACFGHFDHAAAAFSRKGVRQFVLADTGIDPLQALVPLSRELARRARYEKRIVLLRKMLGRVLAL